MKSTPLLEFIKSNVEKTENQQYERLIEITNIAIKEERRCMKAMFISGFMLGNGSHQLKAEVDIEKEFNTMFFKMFEL